MINNQDIMMAQNYYKITILKTFGLDRNINHNNRYILQRTFGNILILFELNTLFVVALT